jgi:hypothetical protein
MTTLKAPPIDRRTPVEVAEQTRALLCKYLGRPPYGWAAGSDGGEAGRALTHIFAHYCGLIIERLNRAPEKNLLAFLDLLGNSPIPAQPARATVTFTLDPTATEGVLVAAGTRLQADPPPGATEPVFFETESELWLSTVDLTSMKGNAADLSALIGNPNASGEPVFMDRNPYDLGKSSFVFGFSVAPDRPLPEQLPVEMYVWLESAAYEPGTSTSDASEPPPLSWQHSPDEGAAQWARLLVEDETQSFTRSGTVRFLTPPANGWKTGTPRSFWVRAKAPDAPYRPAPRLRSVALNTTSVIQAATVSNEVLGSSDSGPNQTFRTARKPVLPGQILAVLEQRPTAGASSSQADPWIVWEEVADFHGSQPLDRHYQLNRQTGEVRFGDGQRGMIPPRGARSVSMTHYRVGGGGQGNLSAGALKTLVSGSKRISRVTNLFAATGGADVEATPALLDRAPRSLRHRMRAVTQEDYEDLAKLASTEVARALCVPLQDLAADANAPYRFIDTIDEEKAGVGMVSVIVVPRTSAAKPLPSPDLLRRVHAYLRERASAEASVTVVGPLYLRVDVQAAVRLVSLRLRDQVERDLRACLWTFLHPLTGNRGAGWPFGRRPEESDLYAEIGRVRGIAFVSRVTIAISADNPGRTEETLRTERFLVYSGDHDIQFR